MFFYLGQGGLSFILFLCFLYPWGRLILIFPFPFPNSLPFLSTQMAKPSYKILWWLCQVPSFPCGSTTIPPGQLGKFKVNDWQKLYISQETLMLFFFFCTTSLIKNPWQYIIHKRMDLNMPIKHNEINANVKAQTLCLGIAKDLRLYP